MLPCSSAGSLVSPQEGFVLFQTSEQPEWQQEPLKQFNIDDIPYYVTMRHCSAFAPTIGCLCGALNHIFQTSPGPYGPSESFCNSIPFPKWNLICLFPLLSDSVLILSLQCLCIFSMLTPD